MTTLTDNEVLIQQKLTQNYNALYTALINAVDEHTNDYFELDESLSLTELCQAATRIQSLINNVAVTPSQPILFNNNILYDREKDIHNKIQYCNNLLRYSLKKNGIDFGYVNGSTLGCNKMIDLIQYITQIPSVRKFEGYIQDIDLTENGDLSVTYIQYEDLQDTTDVVTALYYQDDNLFVENDTFVNEMYDELYVELRLDDDGDLKYTKVKDI